MMTDGAPAVSKGKSQSGKIAGIASCILWVLGFALAFVIPPTNALIWVPDTLLLVGFLPLLFVWRFSWPWLVFGLFNVFIGFVLLTVGYVPDSEFPADVIKVKHHLQEYHPPLVWMIFGALTFLYGLIRLSKNIFKWYAAKAKAGRRA